MNLEKTHNLKDNFGQTIKYNLSKFKRGIIPRKKWINISCKNVYLHILFFIATEFHEILLSGLSGVALTKKRTDGLTDGQKLVAWGIIMSACNILMFTSESFMSTCNIIMSTSHMTMSPFEIIMLPCDLNHVACQHNYVACWNR